MLLSTDPQQKYDKYSPPPGPYTEVIALSRRRKPPSRKKNSAGRKTAEKFMV